MARRRAAASAVFPEAVAMSSTRSPARTGIDSQSSSPAIESSTPILGKSPAVQVCCWSSFSSCRFIYVGFVRDKRKVTA
jgi:hypothetical protein